METKAFAATLELLDGHRMAVRFDDPGLPELIVDEPPPLGDGSGPNPARLLAAAVGNCLAASLLFCLRRARVEVSGMQAEVNGTMARNERGRWRIDGIDVVLHPQLSVPESGLGRCLDLFEDFCIVTGSVRDGLDVNVRVEPAIDRASEDREVDVPAALMPDVP